MATINNLKPGQILWDYQKKKIRWPDEPRYHEFEVKVIEVDKTGEKVLLSWNGNTPNWLTDYHLKKYRVNRLPEEKR